MLLSLLLFSTLSMAQDTCSLEGRLLEKGTRTPLANVNVYVLPAKLRATTDETGAFQLAGLVKEDSQLVINLTGYKKFELEIRPCEVSGVRPYYLERESYQVYETTVFGRENKRDDTTRSLKAKKAVEMPGSFGDPVKAVQNLPGVNRTNSSQVVIQGGSPQDTKYTIDEHDVPLIFHFGGLSSVLFAEATDRIDYLSAGYGAEYSRALSGYINAYTKEPRKDRWGGVAYADFINAGALVEGPVGKDRSLLLGGRYSYIGQVLKVVTENMEDSRASFSTAPSFADLQLIYSERLNEKSDFKLTAIGSRDGVELVLKEALENDPSIRGSFENETTFYRLIPSFKTKLTENDKLGVSLSLGQDEIRTSSEEIYFRVKRQALGVRSEWERKYREGWNQYLGFDNIYSWARVESNLSAPYSVGGVSNPVSTSQRRQTEINNKDNNIGLYLREEVKLEETPWTVQPQVRMDYFRSTREFLPAPRLAARYDLSDSFYLRGASGIYYQPPQPQETDRTYGNEKLKAPRAYHYTLGLGKDFREGSSRGWKGEFGIFWKELDRLASRSTELVDRDGELVAENYNNKGRGRVQGAELQFNYDAQPWAFYLAYTLSKSIRWSPVEGVALSQYDQTHNLNLQGSFQLDNWKFASRFRYVTGNPTTPVLGGIYDSDNDSYIPIRGEVYSERFDPFMQLDLRIDRKFVYPTWILSAYADLQNVTGYESQQGYFYSYDYKKKEPVTGLGFFPSLGVKGEF